MIILWLFHGFSMTVSWFSLIFDDLFVDKLGMEHYLGALGSKICY